MLFPLAVKQHRNNEHTNNQILGQTCYLFLFHYCCWWSRHSQVDHNAVKWYRIEKVSYTRETHWWRVGKYRWNVFLQVNKYVIPVPNEMSCLARHPTYLEGFFLKTRTQSGRQKPSSKSVLGINGRCLGLACLQRLMSDKVSSAPLEFQTDGAHFGQSMPVFSDGCNEKLLRGPSWKAVVVRWINLDAG